ncbi:hypothetical protein jhhlp_002019 [Lomentospora prolificans]|uniref:PXA domain-containing protein n=1 Tax=Lomentospora prolificans TaxID=41688 RepID=A0A2N3NCW5_9PEZI|nr:hypothetical protein jhhlp_002019 [Lomentospora prolificans]
MARPVDSAVRLAISRASPRYFSTTRTLAKPAAPYTTVARSAHSTRQPANRFASSPRLATPQHHATRLISTTQSLSREAAAAAAATSDGSDLHSGKPRLQKNDLFHPLSTSPLPEMRRKAEFIKQHAYCPHPDHRLTRLPTVAPKEDEETKQGGNLAPAHVHFECPDCGIPVYCSEGHWMGDYEAHLEICDTLREINEDEHDLRSGRVFPEFQFGDEQLPEAVVNLSNWDAFMYSRQYGAINEDRAMRHATRLLTYPVTIGSVLHELSPYNIRNRLTTEGLKSVSALRYSLHPPKTGGGTDVKGLRPTPPAMRIFILGARAESSLPRNAWIELAQLFPDSRLHLVFIGPESMANRDDEFPLPERTPSNPFGMIVEDRVWQNMKISTIVDYYHTIHKTGYFAPYDPYFDCFVLFHPGLGHPASSHEWTETLPMLLETKIPIICTGYTQFDMQRDIDWIHETARGEFDILLEPGENLFRSLKWDLNDLDPQDSAAVQQWTAQMSLLDTSFIERTGTNLTAPPTLARSSPIAIKPAGDLSRLRVLPAKVRTNRTTPDYLSDKATAAFIRRTLCPQQNGETGRSATAPIEEVLPPLTSRNDVDLQLYAFLAVILKEFVQAWYSKITPDETFVAEIVQIIAHITRALEQRLRKVDLESLLLDEIPDLLDRHITARRASRNPIARQPTQVNPREVYHSLCPVPYLSPIPISDNPETVELQKENERSYRQLLVRGVLAILLPTEDLANPCLTSLVGEILSETIIGNVIANKASQPWLLWEGLSILARNITAAKKRRKKRDDARPSSASAGQGFSLPGLFFSALHWIFLAYTSIRFLVTTLATASSFPRRAGRDLSEKGDLTSHDTADNTSTPDTALADDGQAKVPFVDFKIWSCISNLLELQSRMPWLAGSVAMLQLGLLEGPGRIGNVDRIMDR